MSKGMSYLHWLLGGTLALVATAALAGEITLYEHPGFRGRTVTTTDALPNLVRAGFNDMASSVIVRDGIWEACSDAYFHGNCTTLRPGEYRRVDLALNDRISSVRQIAYEPGQTIVVTPPHVVVTAPPVVVAPAPQDQDARIVLSQRTRSGVKSIELTASINDLDSIGFSDRADTVTVYGGVWRLCDREGGSGACAEFGPGYYDNLGGLDRNVRSALFVGDARVGVRAPVAMPRVVLYEMPGFAGSSLAIEGGEAHRIASARLVSSAYIGMR
jgi:hypothetical protein